MIPSIDFSKGWAELMAKVEEPISGIQCAMHYLYRCCSVGVMHGVRAEKLDNHPQYQAVYNRKAPMTFIMPKEKELTEADTIWKVLKTIHQAPIFIVPKFFGHCYLLSKILEKTKTGKDDSSDHAYGNYKCSQILLFDRMDEDKDPKKGFNFSYNDVYSVDCFAEWLSTQNNRFGDYYFTPGVPGAHKARVRGGVLTPNLEALQAFEDEMYPRIKEYVTKMHDFLKGQVTFIPSANSEVGKLW